MAVQAQLFPFAARQDGLRNDRIRTDEGPNIVRLDLNDTRTSYALRLDV